MNHRSKLTIFDMVCYLRTQLLIARDKDDQASLSELYNTFDLLREWVWSTTEDRQVGAVLTGLVDATRDSIMRVPWESTIPSIEEIRSALSSPETE